MKNYYDDNVNSIIEYFKSGESNKKTLGLEMEHFVFDDDFNVIDINTMEKCLCIAIAEDQSLKSIAENDIIIEIDSDDYSISLEPGLQFELSIRNTETVDEAIKIYEKTITYYNSIFNRFGYQIYNFSINPLVQNGKLNPEDIPIINKKRYHLMNNYFTENTDRGTDFAKYMMRATASTQVSIDYVDEQDAIRKIKLFLKLTPFLSLLMENHSKLNINKKFKKYLIRNQIWRSVDTGRSGYLKFLLDDDLSYKKYAEYVYNYPMLFDFTNDNPVKYDAGNVFIYEGLNTSANKYKNSEIQNISLLLSIFFPHIRLKKVIEIRYADSTSVENIKSYMSIIKTIAYDKKVFDELEKYFSFIKTIDDVMKIEDEIYDNGYNTIVNNTDIKQIYVDFFEILNKSNDTEKQYIDILKTLPIQNYIYKKNYVKNDKVDIESFNEAKNFIKSTSIGNDYNRETDCFYIPKLWTNREVDSFNKIANRLNSIFNKVKIKYFEDENYRKLFNFDKKIERLILKSTNYKRNIPISRIDMFYNDEDKSFSFCEFNTDGTSSMIEDKILCDYIKYTNAFKTFEKYNKYETRDLIKSVVDSLIEQIEDYYKDNKNEINVVIADYIDKAIIEEFKLIAKTFNATKNDKYKFNVEIADIRELKYQNEKLYFNEKTIDVIYRRAVTSDILDRYDECNDFINAVLNNKVLLLGDFSTQIIHNKIIFKILHSEETKKILSNIENEFVEAHIPWTNTIDDDFINSEKYIEVIKNKNQYIIKPEDKYKAFGVIAGYEVEEDEWKKKISENVNNHYLIQKFVDIYKTKNILNLDDDNPFVDISNQTDVFLFDGKFVGILQRISLEDIISVEKNETSIPSIYIKA